MVEQETKHHLTIPLGLTQSEFTDVERSITEFHTYKLNPNLQCSSLLAQHINAAPHIVWSVVRQFDKPQTYKHFIKSCQVSSDFTMAVGCTREVNVISGIPAETSSERLEILDDGRRVTGFCITGGEHRLRNYRSVTSVHECRNEAGVIWTVVLESYVVDVPEGNTEGDTRVFADTVVKLNLQNLAAVTEAMARGARSTSTDVIREPVCIMDGGPMECSLICNDCERCVARGLSFLNLSAGFFC